MAMNEKQVNLLHRLQMADLESFRNINPLSFTEAEAREYFRLNLPPLEWLDAVAQDEQHKFIEKRFLGVSENNCREQMKQWLEKENLTLYQQPNPQFGGGELWNDYFSQSMSSVNFRALADLFERWEIPVAKIPIPKEQQQVIRMKSPVPAQDIYRRLEPEDVEKELQKVRNGEKLSDGVELGFAHDDLNIFHSDTEFYTLLSPLTPLSAKETKRILADPASIPEGLTAQIEIANVASHVKKTPYYATMSREEIQQEIELFKATGEFSHGVVIGYDNGNHSDTGKNVELFITELSDEELDQLEAGIFAEEGKLHGQKLLGFTRDRNISVFQRLERFVLEKELKLFADSGNFSSDKISIGYVPEREVHTKEFHKPLVPLSSAEYQAIANGEAVQRFELIQAQQLVCRTPALPGTPVYEKSFSALELAFEDCPIERVELYLQYRKELDERKINAILPEQRKKIKELQSAGKGPKIDRKQYLAFTRQDAANYIREHEKNHDNTFEPTLYRKRAVPKAEAFPEIKKFNLRSHEQADYLQQSVIRDLATEGVLASPENVDELLEKIPYITAAQAKGMIDPYMGNSAGHGLLAQAKAYIDNGKIRQEKEIKTIADVCALYQSNKGMDFNKKAALRDLIDGGYIQSKDAIAKIKYTTDAMDDLLIAKYGDARIGKNIRARINSLVDDARIGQIDRDDLETMTIRKAMDIITLDTRHRTLAPATEKQIELLRKMEQRGQIDLQKTDLSSLPFKSADMLIKQNIGNPVSSDMTATPKQRSLLKLLIENNLVPRCSYPEWKSMTKIQAAERIKAVPGNVLQRIMRKIDADTPGHRSGPGCGPDM